MTRPWTTLLLTILTTLTWLCPLLAQCTGVLQEHLDPAAVSGFSSDEDGLVVRYWAWDDLNRRRGGGTPPVLVDGDDGVLLWQLDWAGADVCTLSGPVARTAVLMEAVDDDGFGRWALVNLAAGANGVINVDRRQDQLGGLVSRAVPVPTPSVDAVEVTAEDVWLDLSWDVDHRGEALSDLVDSEGWPSASVRAVAVYVINGPAATARPWDWSRMFDLQADAIQGYSTDSRARIVLPRGTWSGETLSVALALIFDGNGDADGEYPESRSVHGWYLGRPSAWLHIPDPGHDLPVAVAGLVAERITRREVEVSFTGQGEPEGASYRLWARRRQGPPAQLIHLRGGAGSYELVQALPAWCSSAAWRLEVEMLDELGRVIDVASVVPEPPVGVAGGG